MPVPMEADEGCKFEPRLSQLRRDATRGRLQPARAGGGLSGRASSSRRAVGLHTRCEQLLHPSVQPSVPFHPLPWPPPAVQHARSVERCLLATYPSPRRSLLPLTSSSALPLLSLSLDPTLAGPYFEEAFGVLDMALWPSLERQAVCVLRTPTRRSRRSAAAVAARR